MSELTLDGLLDEVSSKLRSVQSVIDQKKTTGYQLSHSSAKWKYFTNPDPGEVCPICLKHDQVIFNGDQVKLSFPYAEYVGDFVTRPRTHQPDLSQYADEPCHCDMILLNPAEAFEIQLHDDKEAVL